MQLPGQRRVCQVESASAEASRDLHGPGRASQSESRREERQWWIQETYLGVSARRHFCSVRLAAASAAASADSRITGPAGNHYYTVVYTDPSRSGGDFHQIAANHLSTQRRIAVPPARLPAQNDALNRAPAAVNEADIVQDAYIRLLESDLDAAPDSDFHQAGVDRSELNDLRHSQAWALTASDDAVRLREAAERRRRSLDSMAGTAAALLLRIIDAQGQPIDTEVSREAYKLFTFVPSFYSPLATQNRADRGKRQDDEVGQDSQTDPATLEDPDDGDVARAAMREEHENLLQEEALAAVIAANGDDSDGVRATSDQVARVLDNLTKIWGADTVTLMKALSGSVELPLSEGSISVVSGTGSEPGEPRC